MKKLLALIMVVCVCHNGRAQGYMSVLNSAQEVPRNVLSSDDGSYAFANFSFSGDTLSVSSAFYGDLPGAPTLITVNDAPPGFVASSPLFDLNIDNDETTVSGDLVDGTFSGSGTLTPQEITDLNNGDLYVNIAASSYPAGAVRGPITAVPEPSTALLMGLVLPAWLSLRLGKAPTCRRHRAT